MTKSGENFHDSVRFIPIQHQFVQSLDKWERMFV
nr:MAG TPA: Aspartate-ammonia ligase [Bacteriophage sp.]